MAAVAVAGVGVAVGAYSAYSSSKASSASAKASNKASDIASEQWQRYLDVYGPIEEKLAAESQLPLEQQPEYAAGLAQVEKGYGDATGNLRRTMGGRYQAGAGLERGYLSNMSLNKTAARGNVATTVGAQRWQRLYNLLQVGRNIPSSSANTLSGVATQQGNVANQWGNVAASGGNMLGQLLSQYGNSKQYQPYTLTPSADTTGSIYEGVVGQ